VAVVAEESGGHEAGVDREGEKEVDSAKLSAAFSIHDLRTPPRKMLAVELDETTEFGLELTLGKWGFGLMMTEHIILIRHGFHRVGNE
jgi:hypothetical protein